MKKLLLVLGLSLATAATVASVIAVQHQAQHQAQHQVGMNRHSRSAWALWPIGPIISARLWPRPIYQLGSGKMTPEERAQLEAAMAPYNKLAKESRELFRAGRLEEAEQKCREALAADPMPSPGSSMTRELADIQLARGKFREALNNYGVNRPKSMRHIPGYPELCMRIAQCYLGLGDIKRARKFYAYATARLKPENGPGPVSPRVMEVNLLLMRGHERSGWPEEALAFYLAAAKLDPENWRIAELIADKLHWLKRLDEAIPYYRLVIQKRGEEAPYEIRMRVAMYDRRKQAQR